MKTALLSLRSVLILSCALHALPLQAFTDADWVSLNAGNPGANGPITAVAADDFGNVYVAGRFTFIGAVPAQYIAKWDGHAWSALCTNMMGGGNDAIVYALAVSGTNLYVGGSFYGVDGVEASCIAKWDGSSWSTVGAGMEQEVRALAISGTNLYAGGYFTTAGGVTVNHIAKWDGSAWSALGAGLSLTDLEAPSVTALAVSGTNLYVGGRFLYAGGVLVNGIAHWNGSAWSALGAVTVDVRALAVSGTNLYVGGYFNNGVPAQCIAQWNGSEWSSVGSPGQWNVNSSVRALAVSGTNVYLGGRLAYLVPGGSGTSSLARWNGSTWSSVGQLSGDVLALTVSGTNLLAGGNFIKAGQVGVNRIARWDGSTWSALGSGMDAEVYALAQEGTNLYVGGAFSKAGETPAKAIARWDGSAWSSLGSGMRMAPDYPGFPQVAALAVSGTNLYAAGDFHYAGGAPAACIAKWDGAAWSSLGQGVNEGVKALAVMGTNLYAGGFFWHTGGAAGGVLAAYIAKWDGISWSPLGSGMGGVYPYVYSLAVSGTNLYAGGPFTSPGNHVAMWDGHTWSALGAGIGDSSEYVNALAVSGTNLYVGGSFQTAGGVLANNIARWDGTTWSALGEGLNGTIWAIAVSGTNLYVAGSFTQSGWLQSARGIARWDGHAWSALGSGVDNTPYALSVDGQGHLFVGGEFCVAGTTVSPFIAQANVGLGLARGRFENVLYSSTSGFSALFADATPGVPYRIQTSPTLTGSWTDLTNFIYSAPLPITAPSTTSSPNTLYRAVSP